MKKKRIARDASQANDDQNRTMPSRTAKKRESAALQKLGEELAALPPSSRVELDLPEELAIALDLHDRITDREGARRQRQYIGRLMRGIDASAIKAALAMRQNAQAAETARFHRAEKLRDRILAATPEQLPGLLETICGEAKAGNPSRQAFLELVEKARQTNPGGKEKNIKAARQLFRILMDLQKKA